MSFSLPRYFTVIQNEHAGAKTSSTFLSETLLPLLKSWNEEHDEPDERVAWEVLTTESPGDGSRLGRLLRTQADKWKDTRVVAVVLGGDGTSHELIQGFHPTTAPEATSTPSTRPEPRLEIIPIPLGTANALYNTLHPPSTRSLPILLPAEYAKHAKDEQTTWSLRSLASFLTATSETESAHLSALPLTTTTIYGPSTTADEPTPVKVLKTHIVLSAAMHANLLDLSEAHRATHPGVERFKLAAEEVLPMQFPGSLTLLPTSQVERYNPETKAFETVEEDDWQLQGPFAYVLSSTLVSRLEAEFVISPLLAREPPKEGVRSMDVVVLRPERSQAVKVDEAKWEGVVRSVMGGAYHDGAHVDEVLIDAVQGGGDGQGVTEVYRVAGFIWEPPTDSPSTSASHVVCADGAIHRIPTGGRAVVRVSGSGFDASGGEVRVWR